MIQYNTTHTGQTDKSGNIRKNTITQPRLKTGQQTNYKDNVSRCFTIVLSQFFHRCRNLFGCSVCVRIWSMHWRCTLTDWRQLLETWSTVEQYWTGSRQANSAVKCRHFTEEFRNFYIYYNICTQMLSFFTKSSSSHSLMCKCSFSGSGLHFLFLTKMVISC